MAASDASIDSNALCPAGCPMSTLTIRNLDGLVKQRLRARAAANGRSMEEEARIAIREHVADGPPGNLYDTLRKRFGPLGGVDLDLPPRGPARPLPDIFDE